MLVSHGTMAEGMRRAAEMVFGSLPDVRHVCLSEDKGIAQFEAELSAVFEELPGGEPVAKADIWVVCLENGRLTRGDVLAEAFADYL